MGLVYVMNLKFCALARRPFFNDSTTFGKQPIMFLFLTNYVPSIGKIIMVFGNNMDHGLAIKPEL